MLGFIVYITLFVLTYVFSRQYVRAGVLNNKKKEVQALVLLLLSFSLIVGLRWDVGTDYLAYYKLLIGDVYEWEYARLEPINWGTIMFVQKTNIPYYTWFIFMAFVQMFFLVLTFRKDKVYLLPLGVFCFIVYTLSFNMNVVRQGCALSIALYSYTFIGQKKWKQFFLFVVLASLFHKTSIILLPLYFVNRINKLFGIYTQLIILFLFISIGPLVIDRIISITGSYWDILNFSHKIDQLAEQKWKIEQGMGIGVLFTDIRRCFIILFSLKVYNYYKDNGFKVFYILFYVGACFYSATMNDMLLERVNRYFSICDIVVSAYFFNYLIKVEKQYKVIAYIFLVGLVVMTMYEVIGSQDWQFVQLI